MITKNSFAKIMNGLRDYYDGLCELEKNLNVVFDDNWLVCVFDTILDALFDDVENEMYQKNVDPMLYQFAFSCNWGRDEDSHVNIDGERCAIKSAEELYDLIIQLKEKRTNEQ